MGFPVCCLNLPSKYHAFANIGMKILLMFLIKRLIYEKKKSGVTLLTPDPPPSPRMSLESDV